MDIGDVEDVYELSPLQQGILFHALFDDDAAVYVNQRAFLIKGRLDTDVLLDASRETTREHTSLRTSFHWHGLDKPLQVVHRDAPLEVTQLDWSGLGEDYRPTLDALLAEDLTVGFDPAKPPLQRLHLINVGLDQHVLVWTHHLLILDGWSVPIFLGDVLRRYFSRILGAPTPPSGPAYRDYIAWLQGQDLDAAKDFWARTFESSGESTTLSPLLPVVPGRPPSPVDELNVDLPADIEVALRARAAACGVTLNTVLHAAWAVVLQRYSGGTDATFGVTSSCRPPEVPDVDRMLGLFTNTLPLRVPVPTDGDVRAWLGEIQSRYAGVRRYEYSPLSQIKQWIGAPGAGALFQSLMIFDNYEVDVDVGELNGLLSVEFLDAAEKTSQPLVLAVVPGRRSLVQLRYHRDRFAQGVAQEILDSFLATLGGLAHATRIADVAAAAAVGPARPAIEGRGPSRTYPDGDATLLHLLERQARATPTAVALRSDTSALSYAETMTGALRFAAALTAAGVGPGHVVGVCAERSFDMVIGILGTLCSGAAYLPLDPALPPDRLAFMVRDAGVRVVIAQPETTGVARAAGARRVLTRDDVANTGSVTSHARPGDPAYVMYTSGSTGRPKGVVISHRAIVNRLLWMQETFALTPADRVLQKTPFGFDVSVWEFFWPLTTGAELVLARPGGHQDAEYLATTIARQRVTTAHFVPSMLGLFLGEPATRAITGLRRVLCSGEALPPGMVRTFHEQLPGVELHNLYGPTEAAVDVTWWDCSHTAAPDVVPIGAPIANTAAVVLDSRLRPVPDEVPGELYLGGVQLAVGYVGRPGLTASTFVAHHLAEPGERLYRTGDRVRRRSDGSLEYLGRLDQQVKVNGYRIELGEIEQVLAAHHHVREAAVVVRDRPEGRHLLAYVTATDGHDPDPLALREHLAGTLPAYMLPASITTVAAMPLSHNGKLNRAALPDPSTQVTAAADAPRLPASQAEKAVAAVFAEVLGLSEVDVTADFFRLGGNSFDAVRAIRRIEGATVGLLGANPTARELAAALGSDAGEQILLRLGEPTEVDHTVVCVPFGGGSAITYQQLARALPPNVGVVAISQPGHELGGDPELHPVEDVAQDATDAVLRSVDGPVSVYGHCAGVALAVELVRRLEAAGQPVERLYLGGSYPFYTLGGAGKLIQRARLMLVKAGITQITATTVGTAEASSPAVDRAEMSYLKSIGGFVGELVDDELTFVMRAFRHDVNSAAQYFTRRWRPSAETPPLAAPITVLAGTADPLTPQPERGHRAWRRFAADVELVTVDGGEHYFHQHQADEVASAIAQRCAGRVPVE